MTQAPESAIRASARPSLHPATLALIVGSSLFVAMTAYMVAFGHQVDWVTYRNATERWLAGQPIYAPAQLDGPYHLTDVVTIGYAYPPPTVVLFLPFALGDWGRGAWLAANIGLFLLGIHAVTRRFGGRATPYLWGPMLGLLAVCLPYLDAVISGNNSLGLAGLFALAVALPGPWVGPASGAAAIGRVTTGAMVLLAVHDQGWKPLLAAAGAAALIVALTLPLVGGASWVDYAQSLAGATPACIRVPNSLDCDLTPVVGASLSRMIVLLVAGACGVAALRVRGRLLAAGLVSLAIIVALPDLWWHHLLFPFVVMWAALAGAAARLLARRTGEPIAPFAP